MGSHTRSVSAHALVVAAFGHRGRIELADGTVRGYFVKGRSRRVVCGDRVSWSGSQSDREVRIDSVDPRENELARLGPRGKREVLAANATQMVVVAAHVPEPDLYLLDRFICAAESSGLDVALLVNKIDEDAPTPGPFGSHAAIGYPILRASAKTGAGLDTLRRALTGNTSILVGQSGVGKSSLVNALVPGAESTTGEISRSSREGRHTTTAVVMHKVNGARLLDTPGVREWIPAMPDVQSIQAGFREFGDYAQSCKFSNCLHTREPQCAVKAGVTSGAIGERRYESYRRLVNLIHQQPAPLR